MNIKKNSEEEHFAILRKIGNKSELSQREMAKELGFSLGKLNYCLKELQKKGLIKMRNFRNNKNKINYFYILTPKGITSKTILAINFMKRKMKEYDELKSEIDKSNLKSYNFLKNKSNKSKNKKIDYDLL
jgi:EPS-associated MarR family transcriptional regulator